MKKGIYPRITQIRKEKGFSQEYMALRLEISQSHYAKIEKGQKELTLSRLVQISEILNINLPQLFEGLVFETPKPNTQKPTPMNNNQLNKNYENE